MSKFKKEWPVQVILHKIRLFVDRRARLKAGKILYTLFDKNTRKITHHTMDEYECHRIFHELYGA